MDFLPVFLKMMELFLIILIGYIAAKCGVMNKSAKQYLSKIVLYISMPCTILSAVLNAKELPGTKEMINLLLVSFSSYFVLYVLAKISSLLLRTRGKEKGVVEFAIMFSNVGFIGFPVTYAIFGSESMIYTTVFNIPFNLLCYSLGVRMIMAGSEHSDNVSGENKKGLDGKSVIKLLATPAMIASILAIILAMSGLKGPEIFGDLTETLGGITTPGALLIIGCALSEMPVKQMFLNVKAYAVTAISVLITPLVMYGLYRGLITSNDLLLGETVIISAMPVATAGTMLCVEKDGDEKFMAQVTFLSTLATVITIPLLATML